MIKALPAFFVALVIGLSVEAATTTTTRSSSPSVRPSTPTVRVAPTSSRPVVRGTPGIPKVTSTPPAKVTFTPPPKKLTLPPKDKLKLLTKPKVRPTPVKSGSATYYPVYTGGQVLYYGEDGSDCDFEDLQEGDEDCARFFPQQQAQQPVVIQQGGPSAWTVFFFILFMILACVVLWLVARRHGA